MATSSVSSRVAIVGAGPGGLAAALLLAKEGVPVTVFEKEPAVGGRTRVMRTPLGYSFDLGPTFFLYPRILADIFAACGERLQDHVALRRLDPQYHLVFEGGGNLEATPDLARLEAEVARLAPADARNVRRFLDDNRRKLAPSVRFWSRTSRAPPISSRPPCSRRCRRCGPSRAWTRTCSRYFADPRVRLAFSFQTKYLGMSPFRCPSLFTILSFLEYEHGVFHPIGGCGAVSEAMARLARQLGVEIRLNTPVERILYRDGEAVGLEAGGERIAAGAVVVNGDFARRRAAPHPRNDAPRWTDRKLAKTKLSCSTFMLYLGLEGDVGDLPHHTILLSREYERNIRRDRPAASCPTNPSFYVQHAGPTDPTLGAAGTYEPLRPRARAEPALRHRLGARGAALSRARARAR